MKRIEDKSSDPVPLKDLISYSFIGVILILVLAVITLGKFDQEKGIEIGDGFTSGHRDGIGFDFVVERNGSFLHKNEICSAEQISKKIKEKLEKFPHQQKMTVVVRSHPKAKMEDFSKAVDLVKSIKNERIELLIR